MQTSQFEFSRIALTEIDIIFLNSHQFRKLFEVWLRHFFSKAVKLSLLHI